MSAPSAPSSFTKDNPFPARMTVNRVLNKPGSGKDTRHFEISLKDSGLEYKVGDSLGVYPTNRATEVDEIIRLLGATGSEPIMLPKATEATTLREALSSKLSLSGPTKKTVENFANRATDAAEKEKLTALLAADKAEALAAFIGDRHFIDFLAETPSAKFTPQEFTDMLRRLQPRLYSISSSPKAHPGEVHLTVAVVRYNTNNRDRVGVCSSFLSDRVNLRETAVPVFVSHSHFGVPEDSSKDVIMIGPGTGIAPFRAFLEERIATGATGKNWLFFGDQRRAYDYLYEDEFEAWKAQGKLARIDLAFSRDQTEKIYVQHRMLEGGAEFWKWLQNGAYLYVCGDAKRMAKDVDAALHQIVSQHGGMDAAAAVEYVKQLKKDKRYQRDVY